MAKENIAATITKTSAPVTVERNGQTLTLQQGDSVYATDVVTTQSASAELVFMDGAKAILSPQTTLTIEEYAFNDGGVSSFVMNLTTGAMRSISGKVVEQNPDAFKVFTPHATVGIRGTDFGTKINEDKSETVILFSLDQGHNLVVTTHAGHQLSLTAPMEGAFIGVDGLGAIIPHVFTDEEIYDFLGFLFGISDEELIKQLHKQLLDEELNDLDDDSAQTLLLLDQNAAAKLAEGQTLDLSESGEVTLTEVPLGDGESGLGSDGDVVLGSVDNDGGGGSDDSGSIQVSGGVSHYGDAELYNTAGTYTLIHHNLSIASDVQTGNVISGDAGTISTGTIIAGNDTITGGNITSGTVTGDAHTISGGTVNAGNDNITLASKTGGASVYGDAYEVSGGTVDFGDDVISITGTFANTTIAGDAFTVAPASINSWGADRITVGTMDATTENTTIYGDSSTSASLGGADTITVGSVSASGMDTANVQLLSAIHGGGGDDVIKVGTLNDNSTVNGDDGNDAITVTTLNLGGTIDGGLGDDTITVATAGDSSIIGGDGVDRLVWDTTVTSSVDVGVIGTASISEIEDFGFTTLASEGEINGTTNAEGIYIGTSQGGTVNTDGGADTVNISSAVSGSLTVNNSDGADILYLNNGMNSGAEVTLTGSGAFTVKQDASTDVTLAHGTLTLNDATTDITLAAMNGGTLTTGTTATTVNVSGDMNNSSYIHGNAGNDSITVTGEMNYATIRTGEGENTISVGSMSYAYTNIFCGDAKDSITVTGNMDNGRIYAGLGNDSITINSMSGGIISGDASEDTPSPSTGGDDTITVTGAMTGGSISTGHGTNTVTVGSTNKTGNDFADITGGEGNDIITVTGAMTAGKIHTGDGENTVTVNSMDINGSYITGGNGTDTVTVQTNMIGGYIYTADGNDSITVNGIMGGGSIAPHIYTDGTPPSSSNSGTAPTDGAADGDDTVQVSSMDGGKIYTFGGADSVTVTGDVVHGTIDVGEGINRVTVGSLSGNAANITGGADDDTVTVNGAMTSSATISVGNGTNTVTVDSLSAQATIIGGEGDDSITVNGAVDSGIINVGDGKNTISIGSLSSSSVINIMGGANEDTVTVGTFTSGSIFTYDGADSVKITTMEGGIIYTDESTHAGNDTVTVTTMNGGTIYVNEGENTLAIETLNGGTIRGAGTTTTTVTNVVTTGNSTFINEGSDAQTLYLNTGIHGGTITLTGNNAGFTVSNAATSPLGFHFQSGTLNASAQSDTISISTMDTGSIYAGEGSDVISISTMESGTIFAGKGSDVISVTTMNEGTIHTDLATGVDGTADSITIGEMAGGTIYTYAGNDTLEINTFGGTIETGSGADSINISGGIDGDAWLNNSSDTDTLTFNTPGAGINGIGSGSLTLQGSGAFDIQDNFHISENGQLTGNYATTNYTINTLMGSLTTAAGDDSITITTFGTTGSITSGNGNDTISVDILNGTINAGHGTNTIYVREEARNTATITANTEYGTDHYIFTSLSGGSISGSASADNITVTTMDAGIVEGGGGDDHITVTTMNGGILDGGEGDDRITVGLGGSSVATSTIDILSGNDTVDINTFVAGSSITINGFNFGTDMLEIGGVMFNAYTEVTPIGENKTTFADFVSAGGGSFVYTHATLGDITVNMTLSIGGSTNAWLDGEEIYVATTTAANDESISGSITADISADIKKAVTGNYTVNFSGDTLSGETLAGGKLYGDAETIEAGVVTNFGADTITLTGITNADSEIYGDAKQIAENAGEATFGADSITISGTMTAGKIYGDADDVGDNVVVVFGNDTITLDNMAGGTIYGDVNLGTYPDASGSTGGADSITISGTMSGGEIVGDGNNGGYGGSDTISVNILTGGSIYGEVGADSISITQMENGYVSGGDGADIINITHMNGGTLSVGDGDDVEISQMSGGTITSTGAATITVTTTSASGTGNATIELSTYGDNESITFNTVSEAGHKVTITNFTIDEDSIFYGSEEIVITSGTTQYTTADGNLTIYFT